MQIFGFIAPPTLACIIAYFLEKKKSSPVFIIGQWLNFAFFIYLFQALVMIPLDRSNPSIGWNGMGGAFLYIRYGKASLIAAFFIACLLGILSVYLKRRWKVENFITEKKSYTRRFFSTLIVHSMMLFMLVLTFSYIWCLSTYGNITFAEIVFNLNMPLKGISPFLLKDYFARALLPIVISFGIFEILVHAPVSHSILVQSQIHKRIGIQLLPLRFSQWGAWTALVCWFAMLFSCADYNFSIFNYITSQLQQSEIIKNEYVDPKNTNIVFPEKKRNLITIYVESCETSSQDLAHGGLFNVNYTPELTQLALEEISFSQSDLLQGATIAPACGWTIAGLVAQSSGLPLKMYTYDDDGVDNKMENSLSFMPGATSLGDILLQNGYKNVFMAGSDFTFGGRRQYYTQHGNYKILDYLVAKECSVIPADYCVNWGIEDEKLYSWAKEELTLLSSTDQPFHFALLTVDTHMPDGYLCNRCPDMYEEKFANVLACSSQLVMDFIQWCREQPFYENTTIVITGDHASMVKDFYNNIESDKHKGTTDRLIYNAFINSAKSTEHENNRLFTTLDFFPTTLASIGVEIEGERLGLGTNLFSGALTLSELYGYDILFEDLNRKSLFYDNKILYP